MQAVLKEILDQFVGCLVGEILVCRSFGAYCWFCSVAAAVVVLSFAAVVVEARDLVLVLAFVYIEFAIEAAIAFVGTVAATVVVAAAAVVVASVVDVVIVEMGEVACALVDKDF